MAGEFICPKSGDPCQNYDLCVKRKQELDKNGVSALNPKLVEFSEQFAADDASKFCLEDRIQSGNEATAKSKMGDPGSAAVIGHTFGLELTRGIFAGTGPAEVSPQS